MRPLKDKFEEFSIDFTEESKFKVTHVSIPSWVKITYKTPISEAKNGRKIYGTTDIILRPTNEKELKKEFKKNNMTIIKREKATVQFQNFCKKCERKGIPRLEKKSNIIDYHARARPQFEELPKYRTLVDRPDEYWLIYYHKTPPTKCRIVKFDINDYAFKSKKNLQELYKHIFPISLGYEKKQKLTHYISQKLSNA